MIHSSADKWMLSGISKAFAMLSPIQGKIAHALLTRAPLYYLLQAEEFSCDLHVLSTPPAFILSQDQTRQLNFLKANRLLKLFDKSLTHYHCLVFKDQNRPPRKTSASLKELGQITGTQPLCQALFSTPPQNPKPAASAQHLASIVKEPEPSTLNTNICQELS